MPPPPAGPHPGFIPYLIVEGAHEAITLYKKAFDAVEVMRLPAPGGLVGHAELSFGGHPLYLADHSPDMGSSSFKAPTVCGAASVVLHRYVPDVDAAVVRAVEAGMTLERAPEDQFYGDRAATLRDPFGHVWSLHTRLRDVSPEEMKATMAQMDTAA